MASITNKLPPPSQKPVLSRHGDKPLYCCIGATKSSPADGVSACDTGKYASPADYQHQSWRPQHISPMRTDRLISPSLPGCLWSPLHCVDGLCCSRVIAGVTWANSAGSEHLSIFLIQAIIAWFSSVLKCKFGELCGNKSLSGFLGTSVMVSQRERRYRWEREWCMWLHPEYRRFAIDSSHFKHLNYWCANSNCESEQ